MKIREQPDKLVCFECGQTPYRLYPHKGLVFCSACYYDVLGNVEPRHAITGLTNATLDELLKLRAAVALGS